MGHSTVPSLRELQDAFQKSVIGDDAAVLELIPANSRTSSEVLLGVYRNAYVGRLVGVVGSDYGRLRAYMGEDPFAEMARGFVKAHPSHTPNARWFAHRLPEYLASTSPYGDRRELSEVAALERALADAFDAADAEVVSLDALRTVPAEQWANLKFGANPAMRRLDQASNAFAIWQTLNTGETPPVATAGDLTRLLVWREGVTAKVRVLSAEEAMLWDEAMKGSTFGALCELAAHFDDPDSAALRAAQALQGWLTAGLIAGASIAGRDTGAAPAAALT